MPGTFKLLLLESRLAVCRLEPDAKIPEGLHRESFYSLTRTDDELSLVCEESNAPQQGLIEHGWRCLAVEGPLDFSEVGVLAALTQPLAEAEISIFVVSTFDTDYLLVKEEQLEQAICSLESSGHEVLKSLPAPEAS